MKTIYFKISLVAVLVTMSLNLTACGSGNMGGDAKMSEGAGAANLNVPVNTNQHTSSDMNITPSDYTNNPETRSIDTIKPKTPAPKTTN